MRILGPSYQMKLDKDKLHEDMGIKHSDFKALSKNLYFFKQL
jgi:hypothetical protein